MDPIETLRKMLDACEEGPLMIHSDVLKASRFVPKYRGKRPWRDDPCQVLQSVAAGRPIWMPTFNYDFTARGHFDVLQSKSQVGALTRYFHEEHADWRTAVPVFSYAGSGPGPALEKEDPVRPFGQNSIFATLLQRNGTMLFYGAPFLSVTFVHHVEYLCEAVYRYDKRFRGKIIRNEISQDMSAEFHVRPMGIAVEYDSKRMLQDLRDAGIAKCFDNRDPTIIVANAREMNEYWQAKIRQDPFYLLKVSCRPALEKKYRELGRRFQVSDFESIYKPSTGSATSQAA